MKHLHYGERPDEARAEAVALEPQERENRLGGPSKSLIGRSDADL